MRSRFFAMIVPLMHCLALSFAGLFLWLWWSGHQAIASDQPIIDVQTGLRYLLLPLILPILHLLALIARNIQSSGSTLFRKQQGNLFLVAVVVLFTLGWLVEARYFSSLEEHGYQPCENRSYGVRSVFITYTKDITLCPKQN